ncbi:contactin-2-like isoform X2 [Physella acuta]|uniref:contactin-2-like isoform X2 n=1 Tax=Physella acuta TaxID=109671 RepID=UPI0027DE3A03|nr:contactin-2-like isoform X2 [Physella acuta]
MCIHLFLIWSVVLCLSVQDVSSQIQPAVTSLENVGAKLTIIIPNTQQANDAVLITITNNLTVGTVVYLFPSTWAFKPSKPNDTIVTVIKSERKVDINIKSVRAQDAGNYKCFQGSSDISLDNCGQMLIVLRKPNPPVITVLSSPLEGETLKLSCTTNSLTLPPDHGLPTLVWWMDQNGVYLVSGSKPRININAKNELELSSVQRTDKGQKFSCKSADGTIDFPKEKLLESATSNVYEVIPEYKPLLADMTITPAVSSDGQISKNIGDQISYTCDISCYPVCEVKWLFKAHGKTSFDPMPSLADTKVLTLGVSRSSHGVYRCMGTNPHGSVQKDFNLNVQYLESPRISINDKQISSDKIVEREAAVLQCTFDANPKPHIRWFLPNDEEIIVFELNSIPQLNTASSGILEQLYTSKAKINDLRCENSGVYRCEGSNSLTQVEGRMELSVMCPPTSSSVYPDLELKPNYVWEIPKSLSFSFVIRGFPEPTVQRVVSDVKGSKRQEKIPEDVEFTKESKYDGKPYMTKFTFFSRRKLDQTDMDREFTVTFESSEFKRDLKFVISPRGPPHVVTNITSVDVKHDSVKIFWISGFDGGEKQTFSVHYRPYSSKMDGEWSVAVENIKPMTVLEVWNEAIVKSLSASTEYEMKVVAINVLGQAESEPLRIKTTAAPDEPLSAGAIVGVVFGVLTLIVIIFLVLYLLVLRKKFRKEKTTANTTTESSKPMMSERVTSLINSIKKGKRRDTNGAARNLDASPKRNPIYKGKNIFQRNKPKNYYPTRHNDDESDESFDADPIDNDYINTEPLRPDYENHMFTKEINPDHESRPAPENKKKKEQLNYTEVEFKGGKPKIKKSKKPAKKEEKLNYSDIDFTKTEELRQQLERSRSQEDIYENEVAVKDGGADGDGDDTKGPYMPPAMGTAV